MGFLEGFPPFDLSLHTHVHLPESSLGKQLLNLFWKVCTFTTECCAAFHHMAAMSWGRSWAWVFSQISLVTYLGFNLKGFYEAFIFPWDLSGWRQSISAFLLMISAVWISWINTNALCKLRWNPVWELHRLKGISVERSCNECFSWSLWSHWHSIYPVFLIFFGIMGCHSYIPVWSTGREEAALSAWCMLEHFCQGRAD